MVPSALAQLDGDSNQRLTSAFLRALITGAARIGTISESFQVSKAKPAPSPSVRKGTPERKKAGTTPARGAFAL